MPTWNFAQTTLPSFTRNFDKKLSLYSGLYSYKKYSHICGKKILGFDGFCLGKYQQFVTAPWYLTELIKQLFGQKRHFNTKENVKVQQYWTTVWGFLLRWPTSSRHIKPLMRKARPCHSIIITSQVRSSKSIAQSSPGKHQPKWRAIYNITLFQPRSKHRINTFGPENMADISQRILTMSGY